MEAAVKHSPLELCYTNALQDKKTKGCSETDSLQIIVKYGMDIIREKYIHVLFGNFAKIVL